MIVLVASVGGYPRKEWETRRVSPFLIAALVLALMPAVVSAHEVEFEAELGELGTAIEGLGGESVEDGRRA